MNTNFLLNTKPFDAKKTKDEIVTWIRYWFAVNGPDCKAVVGISGGKDSSVVAALCVAALGKERVFGVLMPQGEQSDIGDSEKLVRHLGIHSLTCNIDHSVYEILNSIKCGSLDLAGVKTNSGMEFTDQTKQNLPARVRMATLYAVSQSINGRVANTCNLSETLLSWETRWGDAVGDFSPLADLTVQEVKAIGYELGLPRELVDKTPSDGLCGSSDEEALGFSYAVVDRYIRTGEIDDPKIKAEIDRRVNTYRFKRSPIPCYQSVMRSYLN